MSTVPMPRTAPVLHSTERRRCPRKPVTGELTGVVSDPNDPTRPKRICAVRLTDISAIGLGGVTAEPL
ncbi:MAG: hypothetical protein ACODAQ_13290, partial [Phycisphaeraceae bacterium]